MSNSMCITAEEIGTLRSAIPILLKLAQYTQADIEKLYKPAASNTEPKPTTVKETPKKTITSKPKAPPVDIGPCQYINRKVWKDIHSMQDLDSNSQKCTSKACETIQGLRMCVKHKKNDIDGLVKAVSGQATEEDEFFIPDHIEKTHNTEDPSNTEEVIRDMDKEITRLYQQSKHESYSCKHDGEECHMILFDKVAYALDVLGLCLGKITDADVIHSAKMKHKQRQCLEIKGHISKITKEELKALVDCELCTGIAHTGANTTKKL